eukprot:gene12142-12228_t
MNRAARLLAMAPCALALLAALPGPAVAQITERPALSAELQLALAQAGRVACAAQGHDVSVAIADGAGVVRTQISGDRTDEPSIEAARRKAHVAARLGFPTALLTRASAEAPAYVDFLKSIEPQLILLGGGVPIRVRGFVVGAIGLSGAPRPEIDEGCVTAALAAMADRLK